MATLSEAKDVQQRLRPIRRLLDDLDTSVAFMETVESSRAGHESQIKELRQELGQWVLERDRMKQAAEQEARNHAQKTSELATSYKKEKAEVDAKLLKAQQHAAGVEASLTKKYNQLEADYTAVEGAHRATIRDLEAQIAKLTAALDSLRRDVAPLVR